MCWGIYKDQQSELIKYLKEIGVVRAREKIKIFLKGKNKNLFLGIEGALGSKDSLPASKGK